MRVVTEGVESRVRPKIWSPTEAQGEWGRARNTGMLEVRVMRVRSALLVTNKGLFPSPRPTKRRAVQVGSGHRVPGSGEAGITR